MRSGSVSVRSLVPALLLVPAMSVIGCRDAAPPAPDLVIRDAWVRSAVPPEQMTGPVNSGAYMTIDNRGDAADRLVEVGFEGASRVELHESFVDEQGLARMRRVEAVEVPPGGEVTLAPGGLHVMLIGLNRPLTAEDSVPLLLRFEVSGERLLFAEVRSTGKPVPGRETS